jgi:cytochrome c biogenesis protein CcmG/thiol:disulfide interchange protein DsbE
MRRLLLPSSVTAVAAALVALFVFAISGRGTNTTIDAAVARGSQPQAPDSHSALPVLGSPRRISLADLRGKVVVMNVFASWCTPCRAEAPILERAQRQITSHDATVVGVTYLDNSSDSEQFVRREHISYLVLRDVSGDFVRSFGTTGVPETFVINRSGHIAAVRRYQISSQWLARTLKPLLRSSA